MYYDANNPNSIQNALDERKKTMLTAYFAANNNEENQLARNTYYSDFPQHFVWVQQSKEWKIRSRNNNNENNSVSTIGRLISVHPNQGDKYFLRLLLINRKGDTSFVDLRTVNIVLFSSFKEACDAMGLGINVY